MKNTLYIILISICITSCATLSNEINGCRQTINLNTNKPSRIIFQNDTLSTNNKTIIEVERGKEDLILEVLTDSLRKDVTIHSKNSLEYWLNIPTNYGIGMLIDKDNPNRYSYPKNVYLDLETRADEYFTSDISDKTNQLYLHLSIPYLNSFYLQPDNFENKSNTGFWGISGGLDYYYKRNKFLSFRGITAIDLFVPVPASPSLDDVRENMSTTSLELTNNHRLGKFSIGYGISYAWNRWQFIDETDIDNEIEINRRSQSLGLSTNIYYKLGRTFNIGLIYRPTFYRINPTTELNYEHLISLDLAWKIKLKD